MLKEDGKYDLRLALGSSMLPPKRSTRSARVASLPASVSASEADEHGQQVSHTKLPTILPRPADLRNTQDQFIPDTPQHSSTQLSPIEPLQKRTRRKLTSPQRLALEDLASRSNSPSLQARRALAEELGLELKVVSVWFQNKRRPSNKLNGSMQSVNPQERGTRQILGEVHDNTTPRKCPLYKHGSPCEVKFEIISKAFEEERLSPGIWGFLPSSPPGPASEATQSESSQIEKVPESVSLQKRHRSLEWACLNDKRAVKKSRTSPSVSAQESISLPLSLVGPVLQRQRQRTDRMPQSPSASVLKEPLVQAHRRRTNATIPNSELFDGQSNIEKDVLDVALALIQLKRQRLAPPGRKSI